MTYGLSVDDIPQPIKSFVKSTPFGEQRECVSHKRYILIEFTINEREVIPYHFYLNNCCIYYLDLGKAIVQYKDKSGKTNNKLLTKGSIFRVEKGVLHSFYALNKSTLYAFNESENNQPSYAETHQEAKRALHSLDNILPSVVEENNKTFDYREKYWGTIETILDDAISGKKIVINKGGQSSLEYHCFKNEDYYLQKGKLRVGLRFGRGKNASLILNKGESFHIPCGLMHMRMALEDSVIIEISDRDSDRDSYLVEDGMKYEHKDDIVIS